MGACRRSGPGDVKLKMEQQASWWLADAGSRVIGQTSRTGRSAESGTRSRAKSRTRSVSSRSRRYRNSRQKTRSGSQGRVSSRDSETSRINKMGLDTEVQGIRSQAEGADNRSAMIPSPVWL